jgi:hypothetical protein
MANVRIDNLAAEIALAMRDYTDGVSEAIEKELDATSKKILAEVKAGSPTQTGKYRAGWKRKKEGGTGVITYIIHNKNKPGLAHLLEKGHAKRGGGRVAGKPHIGPAADYNIAAMEERIKKVIRNGG